MTACTWDHPGVDAYAGTPRAAIMAMAEIPRPVRLALADRAERHDFDDAVLIDDTSIRGRHAYSGLRSMAFGSRGRVCNQVSWHWPVNHSEGGWVYCDSGYCILMPAACRNWSIVTRQERSPSVAPPLGFVDEADFLSPAGPIGAGPGYVSVLPTAGQDSLVAAGGYAAFAGSSGAGAAGAFHDVRIERFSAPCNCELPPPCVIPAVPEPATWTWFVFGLIALWVSRLRDAWTSR